MKKLWLVIILLVGILLISWAFIHNSDHNHTDHNAEQISLDNRPDVRENGSFDIAVSFYPLQFIAETITGDLAAIYNVSEGSDPHDYQLTNQDLLNLQRSDLVIIQGAEFEPWGDDAILQLTSAEVPYILATDNLNLISLSGSHSEDSSHKEDHHDDHAEEAESHEANEHHEDETDHAEEGHDHSHDHGDYDPHTWLDPVLMIEKVNEITSAVSTLDPENASTYRQNADSLIIELEKLDLDYQTDLAQCEINEAIVSHDAFGYLAKRYNLDMHPIAGISTNDSPSARLLAELANKANTGVTSILSETSSVTEYAETLSRDTGLDIVPINTIAYAIPEGENYLTLMKTNLDSIKTAYACN
jgi:zinc transport system substrate-binding protein